MKTTTDNPTTLPRPAVGTSRLVTTGKVTINYFVSGSGETVILLPGFGRSASDYNELVGLLSDAGYHTVAVELRGVGKSTCPVFPRATIHDFATDVANVVKNLGDVVGGKVHVVGRAFGARVARTFATDYPEMMQSVVLLAGGAMKISLTRSHLFKYILCNLRFIPKYYRLKAVAATLYAPGNPVAPHLAYRHTLRAVRRQLDALRTPPEDIWRDGKTPILWVHGEKDVLVPVEFAYNLRDQFPDQLKLVVIPNAAHALLPEQPEAVSRAITGFLREHTITTQEHQ